MKKLLFIAILAAPFIAPASFAETVTLKLGDMKHKVRVDNLKETSVCTFKKQAADVVGLKVNKFDLKRVGVNLKEEKTMYGSGVRAYGEVQVVPVSYSSQCR